MTQLAFALFILLLFLASLAVCFFIFWAALKVFGVAGADGKRALKAYGIFLLGSIITSLFLSFSPFLPRLLSGLAELIIFIFVLRIFFGVKFWKSLLICLVVNFFTIVATVILSFALILPIRMFVSEPFYVKGAAMEPTYKDHNYLLINKINREYQRGDIVVFRYPRDPQEYFIKRIIALPGETVEIKEGKVYINGVILEEPYLAPGTETFGVAQEKPLTLGQNEYYMLGDNRNSSKDSRSFGGVDKSFFVGKIWFKAWPLK